MHDPICVKALLIFVDYLEFAEDYCISHYLVVA